MVFKSEGFAWLLADIKEQFRRIRCSGQFRLCKFVGLFQFAGSEPSMKICKKGLHGVVHRHNIYFVSVFLHPVISEWWKKGEMAGLRAQIIRCKTFYNHQYLVFRQSQKIFGSAQKPLPISPWPQVLSLLRIWLYKQRSGAVSPFPERQQHQFCSWPPFPSIITPLVGTVNPLPGVSTFGYPCSHPLLHLALLRAPPWCCAPPPAPTGGSEALPDRP